MLEVKNLKKTYHTKKGSCHTALNGVSLRFEDKGMVFILGKSGSGKSTFLNVVSGLDSFDSGEILICGKSTADFSQRDYDAYRNTYMGFIFQEYNILNEFTVKENIALALELQDRSVSDKDIEQMLTVVGLEGLGERASPTSFPADKNKELPLRGRSLRTRRLFLPTNPQAIWTLRRECKSLKL